ncbi:MAG: substrate-binding domain-containing protein [Bacteroidota bacterium]|nr:substrate-binding domain-containing protein [Bacteroidota bacterium]
MKSFVYLFFAFVFFTFISCNNSNKTYTDTPTSGKTKICVDETFKPIIENEINVFEGIYTQASVSAKYTNEVEAFNQFIKDSVNLIVATRPLKKEEKDYFEKIKIYPKEVKIAYDGLALIINRSNNDSLITVNTVKDIISGKINNWKQINSKSKLGDIKVVFDNKSSSTVRYVFDSIVRGKQLSDHCSALKSNDEVIKFVETSPNTIGIIGVSWICNSKDSTALSFYNKVKVMWVSKEKVATIDNSYQPFQAYIAKKLYPFSRNIYMISRDVHSGLSSGFMSFVASDRGQRIILKAGILPATQPIRIVHVNDEEE